MSERAELARLRQGLYRYFGEALSPPDDMRLAALEGAGDYLDASEMELFAFYGPWKAFDETIPSARLAELSTEYVSLFASGVGGALCPPTESYYVGEAEGGKIARVVAQLEREYHDMRLAVAGGSEAPDHVATELEAMSMICSREADAREAGSLAGAREALGLQHRFLRHHLANWLPDFWARVDRAHGVSAYYSRLVGAAYAFVVHEVDLVPKLRRQIEEVAA